MVLIVCAMKLEAKPFLKALDNKRTEKHAKLRAYHGSIAGCDVMVACCGVGIVRSALYTQLLIDSVEPSYVIMSGTAAGVDMKLKIGDTVVSEEFVFHESIESIASKESVEDIEEMPIHDKISMDGLPLRADEKLLECAKDALSENPPEHTVYFGRISTGVSFVRGEAFDTITEKCNPLCADCESAAVAHVCQANNTPFIAVRSMSDTREASGLHNFFRYASLASRNSYTIAEKIIAAL